MPYATKTDFVRAHLHLSNQEILKAAKKEKVSISSALVYATRSAEKAAPAQLKKAAPASAPKGHGALRVKADRTIIAVASAPSEDLVGRHDRYEALFVAIAAEIGFARAAALLERAHKETRAVIDAALAHAAAPVPLPPAPSLTAVVVHETNGAAPEALNGAN